MRLLAFLLLGFFTTTSVLAQEMPTQVRDKLNQIVGTWDCETTVDGKIIREEASIRWTPDRNTIIYRGDGSNFNTGISATFSGILGWDPLGQRVVEQGFNSAGGTMTATHDLSGDRWVSPMRSIDTKEGEASIETCDRIFRIKSNDEWSIKKTNRIVNGVPVKNRITKFRRIVTDSDPIAEELVKAEIDHIREIWVKGDADALAQEFTPDGIRATNISIRPIVGHDAIQKPFAFEFSAGASQSGAKMSANVDHARFITDKHIAANGTWRLTELDGTVSRQGKWGNVWIVNDDRSDCKLVLESAYADAPHQRDLPKRDQDFPTDSELSKTELGGMVQRNVNRFIKGFSNSDFATVTREFTLDGVRSVSSLPGSYRGHAAILRSLETEDKSLEANDDVTLDAVVLNAKRLSPTIAIANGLWQLTDQDGNLVDYGQWGNVIRIRNGEAKLLLESAGSYQP